MPSSKIRVLLDLSMAARGYCGIAQDVRLLYKTLAQSDEVEVTGLIYPPRKLSHPHRFRSARAPLAERLVNQSEYLWSLSQEKIDWPGGRLRRLLSKLRVMGHTGLSLGGQMDRLETHKFWPVVWRSLFAQTLSTADRPLVEQGHFALANLSDGMIYARSLLGRRPLRLDTRGYDFLIVQGPRSFCTSPGTRQIARYHDMIPLLAPDTMGNPLVIRWHHQAIRQSTSSYYVCNSRPTQDTLTSIYPQLAERSATIPYMLSDCYRPEHNPALVRSVLRTRRSPAAGVCPPPLKGLPRYLLAVSTLEPRKNFSGLIRAVERLKHRDAVRPLTKDLRLVIVGAPGWNHEPLLAQMREGVRRGDIIHLEGVPSDEMRVLYSHAEALVFPSLAEGFGFPPLEAMLCGTPAVVSDLAEHRWVMDDAVLYCDPYDVNSIADCIARLVASEEAPRLRSELVARGHRRAQRYGFEQCSRQWTDLLHRLSGRPSSLSEDAETNPLLRHAA